MSRMSARRRTHRTVMLHTPDLVKTPTAPRGLAAEPTRVEWLIDNADAYRAIMHAVRRARHTVWISQLAFDVDCVAYDVPPDDRATDEREPAPVRLVDELLRAARRGVEVRVLVNASLLLDTTKALRELFAALDCRPGRVVVRGVSRFPQLLHAKMLLADEAEAFLIGSPFANG
jgi:phosphatidylserine/phosphatidylglycerophosphate/cardiolipin synthase-like enzyme